MKRYRPERKHERTWAAEYGLKVTPGSGNTWMASEDAYNDELLVQMKHTRKKQITIQLRDVLDLFEHARAEGKTPVFLVRFGEEEGLEVDLICGQPHHLEKIATSLERRKEFGED